jgi:class 3 adenylate cyclase
VPALLPLPSHAFDDPALEREWWAWFAAERVRVLRGGVAVLVAGLLAFAPFDRLLYPDVATTLLWIRVATVGLVACALPMLFGDRSNVALARYGQEWLLYVCTVVFTGLAAIGWTLAPYATDLRIYGTLLAFCLLLAGLYGATGLRFRYAAGLGLAMTGGFTVVALTRASPPPGFLLALTTYGVSINVLGLAVSWVLESEARRTFLRSRELERERARSEELLLNIMPRAWAERLSRSGGGGSGGGSGGAGVDRLAEATVLFATIVGFDEATRDRPPLEVVALLDRLVAAFDALAAEHGVERIKTIGATYMAAAGVTGEARNPESRQRDRTAAVALAVAMREEVRALARFERLPIALRVGLCSGPLVVGVIGRTRYAFDCWGDTVNTAARLDSTGEPDRLHASRETAEGLDAAYPVRPRGRIPVKGKGELETFWVEAG